MVFTKTWGNYRIAAAWRTIPRIYKLVNITFISYHIQFLNCMFKKCRKQFPEQCVEQGKISIRK